MELIISLKGAVSISELGEIESAIAKYYKLISKLLLMNHLQIGTDEYIKLNWEDLKAVIASNPSLRVFLWIRMPR